MHPLFHVGEIAILLAAEPSAYYNTECTIVGGLRERAGFRPSDPLRQAYRALSYEIRTCDGQPWIVHPSCLRKRFQPGSLDIVEHLMGKPLTRPLVVPEMSADEWSRVLEEIAEPGAPSFDITFTPDAEEA